MTLKTYRARTMAEALAEVKKDLGRSAVIVHTRTFRVGAVLGVGGHEVVEITASDSPVPAAQGGVRTDTPGRDAASSERVSRAMMPPETRPFSLVEFKNAMEEPPVVSVPAPMPAPAQAPLSTPTPAQVPAQAPAPMSPPLAALGPAPQAMPAAPVSEPAPAGPADASTMAELLAIKRLVNQVLHTSRQSAHQAGRVAPGPATDALNEHYLRLIEADVSSEIADELVEAVRTDLSAADSGKPQVVRQAIQRRLASLVPVCAESDCLVVERPADGRPLIVALVGPTGVGKTTTIAKLAAQQKLRHDRRVGLITTDTYRIAGVDQLRTYADIIGIPLKVAMTPDEIQSACVVLGECDVILIDTAGRSPRDGSRLEELRAFIDACKPHQVHLVLSSAASQSAMLEAASRFAAVRPDRIIFTKLDEAVNLGVIVNVARRVNLKLSYITNGQEVPDQIEPGRADRVASMVLDCAPGSTTP